MKFRFSPSSPILLAAFLAGFAARSSADVGFTLEIWHGYDFYYPGVSLSATNLDPVTYHRVESPNGIIWKNVGTNNDGNDFFLTNDLAVVLNECNGLWKLYLNKGDGSEQLYHFPVSIAGVTTNLIGDATIVYPAYGSSVMANPPTFSWTGPANLPWVNADAYHDTSGNSYYDSLPGTATSWTPPGLLTPGLNNFFINYHSNNVAGFVFTAPTKSSGTLGGWAAQGDVFSYNYSSFVVVGNSVGGGGGGHTNVAYYSFEDGNIFATDYSTNGNGVSSISSFGGGTAYTTNVQTLGSYAAFFSNNGGSGASWLNPPTNLLATLAGSFSISLWVNTTQATGNDTDDGLYGNVGLVSAFNSPGNNWVLPMAITGNKVTFSTGGSSENYLHSASDINTGNYVHLVVTRNQFTGEKKIYVNGTLDATGTGSTDLLDTPTELNIGYSNGTGFDGRMDEIQIYSGVLSSNEVLQLYNNPGTVISDVAGIVADGTDAHYDFDEGVVVAPDVSGNGNDLVASGAFNGGGPSIDSNAIAGAGSVSFDGGSYLTAPASVLPSLAGNFTVSVWVNTIQSSVVYQNNSDAAGIVAADIPGDYNDMIPVGMDEFGEVVFNTGNPDQGYDDEMYSWNTVNDGGWHHIVVTRDQSTGEKNIYIDGVLDDGSPQYGTTNLLNDPVLLVIGALADASVNDPYRAGLFRRQRF